jgi:heme exporter protein B
VLLARVPCDRGWVFVGKAAANWITLLGVQLWTAALAIIFLDVRWGEAAGVSLAIAALGSLGLAAVGTLLAALSTSARFREFLLPVLLFPLVLPVLVLGSRMTSDALAGRDFPDMWWGVLARYDWAFALIAYFVFDYVLED